MVVGHGGGCSPRSIYGDRLFCPSCYDKQYAKNSKGGCLSAVLIISTMVFISVLSVLKIKR